MAIRVALVIAASMLMVQPAWSQGTDELGQPQQPPTRPAPRYPPNPPPPPASEPVGEVPPVSTKVPRTSVRTKWEEEQWRKLQRDWALDGIRQAELSANLSLPGAQGAIENFRVGAIEPRENVWVTTSTAFTTTHERYTPINLYLTNEPTIEPGAEVLFFGVVESESGEQVGAFEETRLARLNGLGEVFFDRSLLLEPGKYWVTLGVLDGDRDPIMSRAKVEVSGIGSGDVWASNLLLTKTVSRYETLYPSTAPFHFGDVVIVPEGDRTFSKSEELWFIVEVRNVAVKTAFRQFRLGTRVQGETAAGPREFASPLSEIAGKAICSPFDKSANLPLVREADRGCEETRGYLIGQSFPLEAFGTGQYEIEVRVVEDGSGESFVRTARFVVVD